VDGSSGLMTGAAGSVQGSGGASSFVNLLDNAVQEVNGKMTAADVQETKMMTGDSANLHQTMISMQEANVALSLMVAVRNKLVESYQELMRMQV
jgi:flagellar hook-basal body complex protein FliE